MKSTALQQSVKVILLQLLTHKVKKSLHIFRYRVKNLFSGLHLPCLLSESMTIAAVCPVTKPFSFLFQLQSEKRRGGHCLTTGSA